MSQDAQSVINSLPTPQKNADEARDRALEQKKKRDTQSKPPSET